MHIIESYMLYLPGQLLNKGNEENDLMLLENQRKESAISIEIFLNSKVYSKGLRDVCISALSSMERISLNSTPEDEKEIHKNNLRDIKEIFRRNRIEKLHLKRFNDINDNDPIINVRYTVGIILEAIEFILNGVDASLSSNFNIACERLGLQDAEL